MDFFANHKKSILVIVAILTIVMSIVTFLYKSNATVFENVLATVINPMQNGINGITEFFDGSFGFIKDSSEIRAKNDELQKEINELKNEVARLKLMEAENRELTDLLSIEQKYAEHETVGARIISKDPGIWYDKFIINKGSKEELSENMLVLSSEGLCGVIQKTGAHHSQVISLLDETSAISVMNSRTEDIGVIHGEFELKSKFLLKVDYFNSEAQVLEGDEIVTSHISGFPPGVRIGYVTEVAKDINGLTKYAIVKPYADFKHLDTVLVIKKEYASVE